eukprot:3408243-Amphidinium_carterae.1
MEVVTLKSGSKHNVAGTLGSRGLEHTATEQTHITHTKKERYDNKHVHAICALELTQRLHEKLAKV